MNTLTYEQFVFWLKGYLEGRSSLHPTEMEVVMLNLKSTSTNTIKGVSGFGSLYGAGGSASTGFADTGIKYGPPHL